MAPPSWAGIVVLGESAVVTAPTDTAAQILRRIRSGMPASSLTSLEAVRSVLPVTDVLGTAVLGYVSRDGFRPWRMAVALNGRPPGIRT